MRRDDLEWPLVRGALITLVVAISLSSLLVWGSYYFRSKMVLDFNKNNVQFQSISRRYLAVDEEDKLIKGYLPKFISLYNDGVIGPEQRLNWIEVLRSSGEKIRLPGLTYQIKSQTQYSPDFPVTLGHFQLFSSEMILNIHLLHEGDLINLFDMLNRRADGAYSVSSCKMSRPGSAIIMDPDKGNIMVKCELNWFTIKRADGQDIKV